MASNSTSFSIDLITSTCNKPCMMCKQTIKDDLAVNISSNFAGTTIGSSFRYHICCLQVNHLSFIGMDISQIGGYDASDSETKTRIQEALEQASQNIENKIFDKKINNKQKKHGEKRKTPSKKTSSKTNESDDDEEKEKDLKEPKKKKQKNSSKKSEKKTKKKDKEENESDSECEEPNKKKKGERNKEDKKKKKDPNAPKKPPSSYSFYTAGMRSVVKDEMPDLKGREIVSEIRKRWKDLSKEEKVPYEQQALAAKNNYKQQIKRFEKDETLIIDDRTTKSKKTKLTSDDEDESDEFENIEEEE